MLRDGIFSSSVNSSKRLYRWLWSTPWHVIEGSIIFEHCLSIIICLKINMTEKITGLFPKKLLTLWKMIVYVIVVVAILLFLLLCLCHKKKALPPNFISYYLPVSDIHSLYIEQFGNPYGIPIVYIHGGPGGSILPSSRDFFDAKKFNVVPQMISMVRRRLFWKHVEPWWHPSLC